MALHHLVNHPKKKINASGNRTQNARVEEAHNASNMTRKIGFNNAKNKFNRKSTDDEVEIGVEGGRRVFYH